MEPSEGQGTDGYRIRVMSRADLDLAVDWARLEGWNPGMHDAGAFHAVDPAGFWTARMYLGPAPATVTDLGRLFGVTSFELG